MLYLYQATANLKNSEPSYLVFKKRPENKVLLKHLTDVGFEIKDENFQIDMLDTLDEKTILFYPKIEGLWSPKQYLFIKIWELVAITLSAQIATAPYIFYLFG